MSYFRSYFEKNNTLVKDRLTNTSKNPTTEIFYGSSFSKFIFKVDFTDLKNKVDSGYYVLDSNTRHTLHLTNSIFGDETFLGAKRGTGRERTTSFELILFKITEFWDEGVGFDYEFSEYDYTVGNKTYDERPSNWYNRTTLNTWNIEGIYDNEPEIITTIQFDNGNENVNVDITEFVNNILNGMESNQGLGLAFSIPFQDVESESDQSVAFFTKYTQTFYEPYVETFFNDRIDDHRYNFTEKMEQNLYLYVNKGTNFYDLDELPTVDILDSNNTTIAGLTGLIPVKVRKGIYRVTFGINGLICDGKRFYHDLWKNLQIDGKVISDTKQKFIPKQLNNLYSIGENITTLNRYVVQYYGIQLNEKIIRGNQRKVTVVFKSIDLSRPELFSEVYYRMYIKEGRTNVIVHDWTKMDVTNENSFILDTSYYIPREYFIQIKGLRHNEEIFYREELKFEIISEK
jgi:hypothetical protein